MKLINLLVVTLLLISTPILADSTHAGGSGDQIDFGLDVENGEVILYLADKTTNKPLDLSLIHI